MIHYENFTLPKEAFDNFENPLPYYILEIFEKGACEHGVRLGVSFEDMRKRELMWVIASTYYEICGKITPDEEYKLKTWPVKPGRIGYEREYLILDKEDKVIVKGTSNWLTTGLIDRKLKLGVNVFGIREYHDERVFGEGIKRLREEDSFPSKEITPSDEHIDSNGHVNNKHYTTFLYDALGGFSGKVKSFDINYVTEIMPGDKVMVSVKKEEGYDFIKGEVNGSKSFLAKINYK